MDKTMSTLNARVGGTCLCVGAIILHLTNQLEFSLQPIKIFTIGILILGAWAFADEMGLRKPLNRAGFICFLFSMTALLVTVVEPGVVNLQKYYLIYSFALLFSILIWSAAFMHRHRTLKVAGAVGAVASLLPLLILVLGHLSIGAGALFGVQILLEPTQDLLLAQSSAVRIIEAVFIVWASATALFLWKGQMSQLRA